MRLFLYSLNSWVGQKGRESECVSQRSNNKPISALPLLMQGSASMCQALTWYTDTIGWCCVWLRELNTVSHKFCISVLSNLPFSQHLANSSRSIGWWAAWRLLCSLWGKTYDRRPWVIKKERVAKKRSNLGTEDITCAATSSSMAHSFSSLVLWHLAWRSSVYVCEGVCLCSWQLDKLSNGSCQLAKRMCGGGLWQKGV